MEDFERLAIFNQWNNSQKAYHLQNYLKSTAQVWYRTQTCEIRNNYDLLKKKLINSFDIPLDIAMASRKLKNCTQQPHESVMDFAVGLQYLMKVVDSSMNEKQKIGYFIDGLEDNLKQ